MSPTLGAFSYCFHNAGNFFRPQHLFAASSPCPGIRFHPCKAELENLASGMLPGLLPQPGASQHHGLGATAELPLFARIDDNQVHGQETENLSLVILSALGASDVPGWLAL